MIKNKKVSLTLITALAMALVIGLMAFVPLDTASAATLTDDGVAHRGGPGVQKPGNDNDADLAEALGISVEELQVAQQAAQSAAIEKALEDGLITQAQADRLTKNGFRNFRIFVGSDSDIDMNALLAEALGISVDELDAASNTDTTVVEVTVSDSDLAIDERTALKEARQTLSDYIQKDELVAKALGLSLDELQAAQDDGQHTSDLIEELGIAQETYEANLQTAREEALQQAVEDGVLTQEQADLLLENGLGTLKGHSSAEYDGFPSGWEGSKGPRDFSGRNGNGGTDG